jgi:hypothetical protein
MRSNPSLAAQKRLHDKGHQICMLPAPFIRTAEGVRARNSYIIFAIYSITTNTRDKDGTRSGKERSLVTHAVPSHSEVMHNRHVWVGRIMRGPSFSCGAWFADGGLNFPPVAVPGNPEVAREAALWTHERASRGHHRLLKRWLAGYHRLQSKEVWKGERYRQRMGRYTTRRN